MLEVLASGLRAVLDGALERDDDRLTATCNDLDLDNWFKDTTAETAFDKIMINDDEKAYRGFKEV